MGLATRLYRGQTQFALIRRRKAFYAASAVLVLVCLAAMLLRGFNLGTDFKGGATFEWPAQGASVADARGLFGSLGVPDPIVQTVGRASGSTLRVETPALDPTRTDQVIAAISARFGVRPDEVSPSNVGPAWGRQVTEKALQGLAIFLVAVVLYISVRFEPKMAAAAIVALIHDLVLTAGVYAVTQFVVTPSTVIALLTVLGYSLYDTIVVFDKVEENVRGLSVQGRQTYGDAAELAVNQTFMRSINTSLIALLPVSGLLFVGAFLLGAGTLKDLALALFVGLASGAYSSLFLATPLLVDLKEREPRYRALNARVLARRAADGGTAAVGKGRTGRSAARPEPAAPATEGAPPPQVATATPAGASTPPAQAAPRRSPPKKGSASRRKPRRPGGRSSRRRH